MKLFYSYCHLDERFRKSLEKHAAVLKATDDITDWCDRRLTAGDEFQPEIDNELADADIIILSISPDFFASKACMDEMAAALDLRQQGTIVIPLIIRPCDWHNSQVSGLLALPTDGKPVSLWKSRDTAYLDVITGVRKTINKRHRLSELRFTLRDEYIDSITETDFISQNKNDVRIDDVFVFPNVVKETPNSKPPLDDLDDMLSVGNNILVKGDYRSGKTTLCRKLLLEQATTEVPVIMLSGSDLTTSVRHRDLLYRKFNEQYKGSFSKWDKLDNKMLIVDDLLASSNLNFISFAKDYFQSIVITLADDDYLAYFKDERELAPFEILTIRGMKHSQQEDLIKKWKSMSRNGKEVIRIPDGMVDHLEDRINSIVLDNKVVPRYPFYVLSILQTYEAFMPQGIQITAFGHCYHALITAQIVSAGIRGDDVDSVFNFLSHFAYYQFRVRRHMETKGFEEFVREYRSMFVIKDGVFRRIVGGAKPLLRKEKAGFGFRYPYVYYFLLGYYFARHRRERDLCIEDVVEKSYLRDNTFVLIFAIHHAYDEDLIDHVLRCTRAAMEKEQVATLEKEEVRMLEVALLEVPEDVVSRRSVAAERRIERDRRDQVEAIEVDDSIDEDKDGKEEEGADEIVNDILRALKNMEIMGQILRNKYGSLSRDRLKEIVRTIADAGLRLVSAITSEESIVKFEDFLTERMKDIDRRGKGVELAVVQKVFRGLIIELIYTLVKRVAGSIGKKEVAAVVDEVVREKGTAAYDLIGAFYSLRAAEDVEKPLVDSLVRLLRACRRKRNRIARRLISQQVQLYLSTHWVEERLRNRLFGALELVYRPNVGTKHRGVL